MAEHIYIVHPERKELTKIEAARFSEIGIRERKDFQEWVIRHPDVLGEDLLIITSEFDGFDRTSRRLDVLALDKNCTLVVIELKLEVENTFADLQAIRYAAFCDTMTMDQVVDELALFRNQDKDTASKEILKFLDCGELPKLEGRPRIILAASSMNYPELTSAVLWLRTFEMDISCVELTPFSLTTNSGEKKLLLVPKVIIPLPEAKEYQIRVERKQAAQAQERTPLLPLEAFWSKLFPLFNRLCQDYAIRHQPRKNFFYVQINSGIRNVHYRWKIQSKKRTIDIGLHFESQSEESNEKFCKIFRERTAAICATICTDEACQAKYGRYNGICTSHHFEVNFADDLASDHTVESSAVIMSKYIQSTVNTVHDIAKDMNWS
ncbi:MAG: hypothetical protein ACLGSA_02375 [Acidobacteriota bacterium]